MPDRPADVPRSEGLGRTRDMVIDGEVYEGESLFPEVDPFTCRREGHIPAIRVTSQNVTSEKGATYLTSCQRCEKVYEEALPDAR